MALRIAFGLVLGFVLGELTGTPFFFLPPLMAVQFLAAMRQPPSLRQGIGLILLTALLSGLTLVLASFFADQPLIYLLLLSLLLFFGFQLDTAGKTMPATLLLTLAATIPLTATQSFESAGALAGGLVEATAIGLLVAWAMFAAFPAPSAAAVVAPPPRQASPGTALANTLLLLPVLVLFMVNARMTFVVLMVIVAIIRLNDRSSASRAMLGLLVGNILGGMTATVAYGFVAVMPGMVFFLLVVLLVGLTFAGQIAAGAARAPIFTMALVTFVILLGLGVSPLPTDTGEAFTNRLWNVLLAGVYAVGAISLIRVRKPDQAASGRTGTGSPAST
jgi:hypothetical protein